MYIYHTFVDTFFTLKSHTTMIFMTRILSNWAYHIPFFNASSDEFYLLVEKTIRAHDIPNATKERAKHKEKGFFSANREYLRIRYDDLVFDICAAPFGKDFYVSWWMYESEDFLRMFFKNTKLGDYLTERASKLTFYQADNEAVFKRFMHNAIVEAIDTITTPIGFRLPEDERTTK